MKGTTSKSTLCVALAAVWVGLSAAADHAWAEDVARDITGWTSGYQVKNVRQLADRRVEGALAGKDPQVFSAPNLGIDLTDTTPSTSPAPPRGWRAVSRTAPSPWRRTSGRSRRTGSAILRGTRMRTPAILPAAHRPPPGCN